MKKIYILIYKIFAKRFPTEDKLIKKIRYLLTKKIIKKCGKNVNICQGASFSYDLEIGDNSGIGKNSHIESCVKIGKDVMMGPECYIYTRNHNSNKKDIPMIKQGFTEYRDVIIEDDVWIGSRVTILPGVKISKGTIIGAGSVVTKSTPEYSIVCGNPAVVKKER